ncbi:hypothetical protein C8F01DRAFT_966221, partial [Mycena amicta]
ECDIIVFRRKGSVEGDEGDKIKENFRVRQDVLRQWLQYLEQHHPTFHGRQVHIDWDILNSLPKDGNVLQRVQSVSTEDLNSNPDEGPPVENQQSDGSGQFSAGFAPNLQSGLTEFEKLQAAAGAPEIVLTMPAVQGTPINENSAQHIAVDAFPTLFPTGRADFKEAREKKVTMDEWASHLLRYQDGRFAKHPRFRYWALNTIFRKR